MRHKEPNTLIKEAIPAIVPTASYSDREVAKIILRDQCNPTSWKTIQAHIRGGKLKGRKVGRSYCILGQEIMNYLAYRNGRI